MFFRLLVPLVLLSTFACGQTPSAAASNTPAQNQSDTSVLVYHAGDGLVAPELRPTDFSPIMSNDCKYHGVGIVRLSLFVDSQGKSQNITPVCPRDDDFERVAVGIASADHFAAGTKDGVPVAVAQELEIELTLCTINITDKSGQSLERLRLKSLPVQKMFSSPKESQSTIQLSTSSSAQSYGKPMTGQTGGSVSAPVPRITPEPEYPIEERNARIGGICLISLIVDANGIPQNLRVIRGINEVLNEKALDSVAKFRFKPAMKNKQPVPVMMSIEVNFRY